MSAPFVAEIRMWGCNFAPRGWAACDGQLLPISQFTVLFSLIGTYFGGNGTTNFQLPQLQGSAPVGWGQGSAGTNYELGQAGGEASVALTTALVPPHTHALQADARPARLQDSSPLNSLGRTTPAIYKAVSGAAQPQPLALGAVLPNGGGNPHNNLMPFQAVNFCIALQGIYPQRP